MHDAKNDSFILGYGTSHDCGIAIIQAQNGYPLFCATLERMSRRKDQVGTPMPALNARSKNKNSLPIHIHF